jgi:hypothetical protein
MQAMPIAPDLPDIVVLGSAPALALPFEWETAAWQNQAVLIINQQMSPSVPLQAGSAFTHCDRRQINPMVIYKMQIITRVN